MFAICCDHSYIEPRHIDGIARMKRTAGGTSDRGNVSGEILPSDVGVFAVHAMVEKLAYLNAFHQFRHPAHMVGVEMRDQDLIDLSDPSILHHCLNSLRIAPVAPGPARIN